MAAMSRKPAFNQCELYLLTELFCLRQRRLFPGSSRRQNLARVRRAWERLTIRYNRSADYPREVSPWEQAPQPGCAEEHHATKSAINYAEIGTARCLHIQL